MGLPLIDELLGGESNEIQDLAKNEAILVGFLTLVKGLNDLPDMASRFYEAPRSLYKVTSSARSIETLIEILSEFFGSPDKAPGMRIPVGLRFDPIVKHLGGVRKDQALFLKRLKTGSFFGALWPWQNEADKIEVLLGFHSTSMRTADYSQLETLVKKFLAQKKIESMSGVGGQIHGISLPSFLQMSEMEGASYTLKVSSNNRTGYLYLDNGNLIAAQSEGQTGATAAHRIISWDNPAIQIEPADIQREREIHEPLMHVMMESLKIKDESGAEAEPDPADAQASIADVSMEAPAAFISSGTETEEKAPDPAEPPYPEPVQQDAPADATDRSPISPATSHAFFEKRIDQSIGKQGRMARTGRVMLAFGVVVLIVISAVGGGVLIKKRQVNQHYDQLQSDLAVTAALDARIVMIMKYLKANPGTPHQHALETRLKDLDAEIEKRDYEQTMLEVNRLPIDEHYEQRALSLYTAFLNKYPQSAFADDVSDAIGGIRRLLGAAYFEDLKKVATADFTVRYNAYRSYLNDFPDSTEREAVAMMIEDLTLDYLAVIESGIERCDAKKRWDDCIAQCDWLLSVSPGGKALEQVTVLRSMLQDKKDAAGLDVQVQLAGSDLAKAKQIYTDYLAKRPDTTQKEVIHERIRGLESTLARADAWNRTADYASNPEIDIFKRLARLNTYLKNNATGPYASSASALKAQLEPELKAAIRARDAEKQQRKALATQQAKRQQQAREAQRIRQLMAQVARQLEPVADRFVDNADGTVTDRLTGLKWSLLDSHLDLGQCISYHAAKAYVEALELGGHSDWRLPTAGELATIYKNSPFFPDTGAAWYWTSESFARGYHRVVDVVTSVPETVFTRVSKPEKRCGAVRAVR
jgi:hypothetical protein